MPRSFCIGKSYEDSEERREPLPDPVNGPRKTWIVWIVVPCPIFLATLRSLTFLLAVLHPQRPSQTSSLRPLLLTLPIRREVILTHIFVTCVAVHTSYALVCCLLTRIVELAVAFGNKSVTVFGPDIARF